MRIFMVRFTVKMCALIRVQTAYTRKHTLLQFTPNVTAYFTAHSTV
jgi:hypothetical protein